MRVWHNHPGRRVHLQEMKTELPKANSDAMKVVQTTREFLSFFSFLAEVTDTDRGNRVSC